jgi:hypothetical protein
MSARESFPIRHDSVVEGICSADALRRSPGIITAKTSRFKCLSRQIGFWSWISSALLRAAAPAAAIFKESPPSARNRHAD